MVETVRAADYVTLALGAEIFAVPVGYVREILDFVEPFKIPEAPDYLLGLIDVRGHGTPMIDLRRKLGLSHVAPKGATRILVLDIPFGGRTIGLGLVADRVIEVASFAAAEIEPVPEIGTPWRSDYISGIVRRASGFTVLFNLPKLLESAVPALAPAGLPHVA
jgi:purine-binding chemotaxis protein CheW